MKHKVMTTIFALVLVAGFAASVSAGQNQDLHGSGDLYLTKNCAWKNSKGYCFVTSSNLAAIPSGVPKDPTQEPAQGVARIYYSSQQAVLPDLSTVLPFMLDQNIVLYVSPGNWAVGHCTLDFTAPGFPGLCTLTDGIGDFAGFHARVDVSFEAGVGFKWDGTYSFNPEQSRR